MKKVYVVKRLKAPKVSKCVIFNAKFKAVLENVVLLLTLCQGGLVRIRPAASLATVVPGQYGGGT